MPILKKGTVLMNRTPSMIHPALGDPSSGLRGSWRLTKGLGAQHVTLTYRCMEIALLPFNLLNNDNI